MSALPAQVGSFAKHAPKWREATQPPPGFITVAEAVQRASKSDHYHGARNQLAIKRWVHRVCEARREASPSAVMVDGRLYLPRSLHPAFQPQPAPAHDIAGLEGLPEGRRNRAIIKLTALRGFECFCGTPEGKSMGKTRARTEFVRTHAASYTYRDESGRRETLPLSVTSMSRWEKQYTTGGLKALAEDGRGGYDREGPSQEAIDHFFALYFDRKQRSLASCWRTVTKNAQQHGWRWFSKYVTCVAWARGAIDQRASMLMREGEDAYRAKCEPFIEPDPESFAPGACWMSDHSVANCWVRMPSGRIIRPFVTIWQDWRSRVVVDATVGVVGTQEQILTSFRAAAREYGLPETVQLDNGKDYQSYLWTGGRPRRHRHRAAADFNDRVGGLFTMLNIQTTWGAPYNPNSKARVEAWFRHLDAFCKEFDSYCGNAPANRPDAHAALVEQAVDFDEFNAKLREWVASYNARPHGADDMHNLTPRQVIAQAPSKRVLTDQQANALLAAWPKEMKVARNGVKIRIAGESFGYGQFDPALKRHTGQKVRVSYDPADLSRISVWTLDGQFICSVEENHRFDRSVSTEELREALREKRRAKRALRAAARVGVRHLTDSYAMAVAGMAADAARRRKPDPLPPDGGMVLKPVQTAINCDSKQREDSRRVAGGPDAVTEAQQRLADFARRSAAQRKTPPPPRVDPLIAWAQREAAGA